MTIEARRVPRVRKVDGGARRAARYDVYASRCCCKRCCKRITKRVYCYGEQASDVYMRSARDERALCALPRCRVHAPPRSRLSSLLIYADAYVRPA